MLATGLYVQSFGWHPWLLQEENHLGQCHALVPILDHHQYGIAVHGSKHTLRTIL